MDTAAKYYKCKKCRCNLFIKENLSKHSKETGDKSECKVGYYITESSLEWLNDKIEGVEGKINCPKCESKIGNYNWCGFKCSCDAWIAPAFHISQSKVDEPLNATLPIVTHQTLQHQQQNTENT